MRVRLEAVGLSRNGSYDLPVTQSELADALGLSAVHVNRTLQTLRSERLITLQGGKVTIEDWDGLRAAGEFDAKYLSTCHREDREKRAGRFAPAPETSEVALDL
jgi:DNA-binding Lrp family transcriptional regulator